MVRKLMAEGKLDSVEDEQIGDILQEMLEAEMDEHLGYSKYDYKNKDTQNSKNRKRKKTVRSNVGSLDLKVPRDRESEFEPVVVKKNQRDISSIESQVLSMYAKGMSTRDIIVNKAAYAAIGLNMDGMKDVLGIWVGENGATCKVAS